MNESGLSRECKVELPLEKSMNITHHMNILKKRKHKIISMDAVKVYAKLQHPFFIFKKSQQIGIETNTLNQIKVIYNKTKSNVTLNKQVNRFKITTHFLKCLLI